MTFSSSPVMPVSARGRNTRLSSFFHCKNSQFSGVKTTRNTRSSGAASMAKLSAFCLARLFGEISPKISTTTVITTVEMVTPLSPRNLTNTTVAMDAEAMLTMLLPMRMVESSRS